MRAVGQAGLRTGQGWRVIDRVDRNIDGRRRAAVDAVIDAEGKAVGAVIVGRWRIGIGAVGIDNDVAVGAIGAKRKGQRVVFGVGAGQGAVEDIVLIRRGRGARRRRREVIDIGISQRDRAHA